MATKQRRSPRRPEGVQVCHLTLGDIEHYQRIVAAIARTVEIMVEIDTLMLPMLTDIDIAYVATPAVEA